MKAIAHKYQELTYRNIGYCNKVQDDGIRALANLSKSSEKSNLAQCEYVNDDNLIHIVSTHLKLNFLRLAVRMSKTKL